MHRPADTTARGRTAETPTQIPREGWRDIAWRTWSEFNRDRIPLIAAGSTFYALLSFVPALASLIALYGLVFDQHQVAAQVQAASRFLPSEVSATIQDQLQRLTSQPATQLGLAFAASLAFSLWSASSATKSVLEGLNVVYDETEKRSFLGLNATALALTLAGIATVIAVLASAIILPVALSLLPLGTNTWIIQGFTAGGVVLAGTAVLLGLYRWGPSRQRPQWRWLVPGALAAVILLALATAAFSWYARTFGAYSAYGSIGSIIGFMTWVWLSMIVVLTGAEFNAEIEHQTAQDSTLRADQPIGKRGAVMADTVGAPESSLDGKAAEQEQQALASSSQSLSDLDKQRLTIVGLSIAAALIAARS